MSVLGLSDESFKKSAGKTFSDVVEDWGNLAMERLRKSLRDNVTLTTSKKLEQSIIAFPVQFKGNQLTVEIKAAEYWKYVNEGVQGVGGNMADGKAWTKKNSTSPFSFKKDKKPSVKHFIQWSYLAGRSPFAVRETVFRSGIKGNHFFDEVIDDKFEKELANDLKKVMSKTIEVDIKADFDGK